VFAAWGNSVIGVKAKRQTKLQNTNTTRLLDIPPPPD
jgi:hypothetical protein